MSLTDVTWVREKPVEAAEEIDRLRRILQQFADNQLSDENCASVDVAAKRIRGLARAALQGRD